MCVWVRACVRACVCGLTCSLKHCTTMDKDVARSEGKKSDGESEEGWREGRALRPWQRE